MKIIQTSGGALIGLPRAQLDRWSGVFGNNFFQGMGLVDNDYDALYTITDIRPAPVMGVVSNGLVDVFFVSEPLPTLIVDAGPNHVYIAQIDTQEEGWAESELRASDFEGTIEWQQPANFRYPGGEMVIFNSPADTNRIGNEYFSVNIEKGTYICEWSRQDWDGKAELIFIRIVKDNSH